MKKIITSVCFVFLALGLSAQEEQEMVKSNVIEIHVGGKVLRGPSVEYRGGKVHLALGPGGSTGYDIDKVQKIVSPMPSNVRNMWNAFLSGRFDKVATPFGKQVMEENRFLGWGKRAAFAYGYSLVKLGKAKEGKPVLTRAGGYIRGTDDKLDEQMIDLGIAAAEMSENKTDAAKKALQKIAKDLEPEAKAIYYNIEGDIFIKGGDENQAVLSYYKALLLDKSNPYERAYAKTKIQAVYKKLNDPRAEQIKNLN